MRIEELGLGLPSIAALAVPVLRAQAVERAGAGDGDARSRDGDQRSGPLFVPECRGAGERDGSARFELSKVEGASSGNGEVADSDRGTARDG